MESASHPSLLRRDDPSIQASTFLDSRQLPLGEKTSLRDKGFYRQTVSSLTAAVENDAKIFIEGGATEDFSQTWVMIKKGLDHFDEELMKQFHSIMFATSLEQCKQHFPKSDGEFRPASLNKMRLLMS